MSEVVADMFDKARAAALAGPTRWSVAQVPMLLKDHLTGTAGDPMYEGMRFRATSGMRAAIHVARSLRRWFVSRARRNRLSFASRRPSRRYGAASTPGHGRSVEIER
jgi:hypothetical protein